MAGASQGRAPCAAQPSASAQPGGTRISAVQVSTSALLKAGVFAMAGIDAVFIFGDFFGEENAQYNAAAPAGLARLQVADVGDVSTGYGDFFVAGLVGGILALERRPQVLAAVATFAVAQAFNQLFLVVDSLPGTVPPALVLLAFEVAERRRWASRPATGRVA